MQRASVAAAAVVSRCLQLEASIPAMCRCLPPAFPRRFLSFICSSRGMGRLGTVGGVKLKFDDASQKPNSAFACCTVAHSSPSHFRFQPHGKDPGKSRRLLRLGNLSNVLTQQQALYQSTQSLKAKGKSSSHRVDGTASSFLESFDDYRLAFVNKTTLDIIRALGVLWFCSFEWLADNSLKLMSATEKVLGRRMTGWLLRKTVYRQYVAGDSAHEIKAAVTKLQEVHVGPLLAAPMEDDVHADYQTADKVFDDNLCAILKSMAMSRDLDPSYPMIQLRITALMPGNLCAFLSQKCPEPSSKPSVVDSLAAVLGGQNLDSSQIFGEKFPEDMERHLDKGLQRIARVCEAAVADQVTVMVDAEYTYLNPALNLATLAMMLRCNTSPRPPLVFYTYQNYLKSTKEVLLRDLQFVESRDVGFGAKLVRGAYMHKERLLAAKEDRQDPVQDTFDATSAAYNEAVAFLLDKVAQRPDKYRVIVASHNEQSALLAAKRMHELGISRGGGSVFFGQLYGMADHMSTCLGMAGYLARKSIPYGPVHVTLPYLCRRFQENKTVFAGARRERSLLTAELKNRFFKRK